MQDAALEAARSFAAVASAWSGKAPEDVAIPAVNGIKGVVVDFYLRSEGALADVALEELMVVIDEVVQRQHWSLDEILRHSFDALRSLLELAIRVPLDFMGTPMASVYSPTRPSSLDHLLSRAAARTGDAAQEERATYLHQFESLHERIREHLHDVFQAIKQDGNKTIFRTELISLSRQLLRSSLGALSLFTDDALVEKRGLKESIRIQLVNLTFLLPREGNIEWLVVERLSDVVSWAGIISVEMGEEEIAESAGSTLAWAAKVCVGEAESGRNAGLEEAVKRHEYLSFAAELKGRNELAARLRDDIDDGVPERLRERAAAWRGALPEAVRDPSFARPLDLSESILKKVWREASASGSPQGPG